MEKFQELSEASRVWVYTASRELTPDEVAAVRKELDVFTHNWAAHGAQLQAKGDVLENKFIVLVADETNTGASGCSIDTSVQFIRALEEELGIKLFDRMYFYAETGEKIHFSDLSGYNGLVFNSMVTTLGELKQSWLMSPQDLLLRR